MQPLGKLAQLRVVQPARGFLAVTGDKGHGRAVVQKLDGGGDLGSGGGEFLREDLGDVDGDPCVKGADCLNLIIGDSYSGCMYRKGRLKPAIIED